MDKVQSHITSVEEKIEGISSQFYNEVSKLIDKMEDQDSYDPENYQVTKLRVANFVFFIHERLEEKITRSELNYKLIRKWASRNLDFASYLLSNQYPKFNLDGFYKWAQPEVPISSMGMYHRSNAATKDTFH